MSTQSGSAADGWTSESRRAGPVPAPDSSRIGPIKMTQSGESITDTEGELPPRPQAAVKAARDFAAGVLQQCITSPEAAMPTIAGYEILGKLGRGGMGVVYQARQIRLNRMVAIKMVLAGAHADSSELSRFRRETESVARLQHANIVQVFEAGEQNGCPYFTMEFVDSGSLAQRLAGKPQTARLAAQVIETLAKAVHFAHQNGVLHRDLKPANVLLARSDRADSIELSGWEDAKSRRVELKISDFGLAKRVSAVTLRHEVRQEAEQTKTGELLGTPSYMAPEQVEGKTDATSPATDAYALGVMLYEMLTGRPPFFGATVADTLRQVQCDEPLPPSRLQPGIPRDLETICLKCLQKQPRSRYANAAELADDVRRFLSCEPIQARRSSAWDRLAKWSRRRPALTALIAVSALAVSALSFGGWWSSARLNAAAGAIQLERNVIQQQRDAAERQRDEEKRLRAEAEAQRQRAEEAYRAAQRNLYVAHMNLAQNAWREANVAQAVKLLEDYRTTQSGQEDLRGFEWQYLWRLCHAELFTYRGHDDEVETIIYSPDGRLVASSSRKQVVKLCDVASCNEILSLPGAGNAVAFSPDGQRLATGGNRSIKLWDVSSGELLASLDGHKDRVAELAFSADGTRIMSASYDKTMKIWDVTTGQTIETITDKSRLRCAAVSPDGERIATASDIITIWNVKTGMLESTLQYSAGAKTQFTAIAFSSDGRTLAAGGKGSILIWSLGDETAPRTLAGHVGTVAGVAFSPDGRLLVSGGFDQVLRVWDVATGQETLALRGHLGTINRVTFSPDGQRLGSASRDGTVKIWDASMTPESRVLAGHDTIVESVAFSPDNKLLASASGDSAVPGRPGKLKIWDVKSGRELQEIAAHSERIFGIAFSPDGKSLASVSQDKTVKIWGINGEVADGELSIVLAAEPKLTLAHHSNWVTSVAYSFDGKYVATGSRDKTIRIVDAATGQEVRCLVGHSSDVMALCFRKDGKFLASCSGGNLARLKPGEIMLWDIETGTVVQNMTGHTGPIRDLVFSPDGRRLASTSSDKTIKLWDVETGREELSLQGHNQGGYCLAYSPDGRRLASGSNDINAKIWDTVTGRELLTLRGHTGGIHSIAFSPDGLHLGTGSYDGTVRIWDATPLIDE